MSKLLLAFSIVALFYGGCAFGMDYDENELYENPWKDKPSESQNAKSQTVQSKDELLELQREKIAKYESALQKLTQQLRKEREINKLAEVKIEKLQQKLENVKIENRIQKPDKNDKNLASDSKQDPKPLTRLERQKQQLQQQNAEFKTNQKEIEKLRKEFRKSNKTPNNESQKVKKMVEQIEQRSRPSFGIEVNHKPTNLVLGKKNKQLFDKEIPNDMDWESTPSASILEQQEIQTLNQQLANCEQRCKEANETIEKRKKELKKTKLGEKSQDYIRILDLLNKTKDSEECEKLVRDGTFASILQKYHNSYDQTLKNIIMDQLKQKGGITTDVGNATVLGGKVIQKERSLSFRSIIAYNEDLFKDPDFVISLKPGFAKVEKYYENDKESEMWIPFAIVKNLEKTSQKTAILVTNDGNTVETTVIGNPTSQRNNVNVQTQERIPSTTSRGFTFGQQPQYGNTFKTKSKKSAKSAAQALPI